jgi:tRNA-specific 2-thiouridylase
MSTNTVYVTTKLDDEKLWTNKLIINDVHWINDAPEDAADLCVRIRHRGPLLEIKSTEKLDNKTWALELANPERAVAPGQSAVIYKNDQCLGGGFIA